MNNQDAIKLAAQLGVATGIRSMTPLAAITQAAASGRLSFPQGTSLNFLSRPEVATLCLVMVAGEIAADASLPVPNRTSPLPLAGRIGIGALAGAAIVASQGQPPLPGGAAGGLGAFVGSFAGYGARMVLVHKVGVPDFLAGLMGSALCAGIARRAVSHASSAVR